MKALIEIPRKYSQKNMKRTGRGCKRDTIGIVLYEWKDAQEENKEKEMLRTFCSVLCFPPKNCVDNHLTQNYDAFRCCCLVLVLV